MDEDTELGPMAREDLRDKIHQQVQDSVNAGAKVLVGGEIPQKTGYYYPQPCWKTSDRVCLRMTMSYLVLSHL